jgi:hypothetical protein
MSSSKSIKFIDYIRKNSIRSCQPLIDKVNDFERDIKDALAESVALIKNHYAEMLESVKTTYDNNPDCILEINKVYQEKEDEAVNKFAEKKVTIKKHLLENWLKTNKNCIDDMVADIHVAADGLKSCELALKNDQDLSGCVSVANKALEKF